MRAASQGPEAVHGGRLSSEWQTASQGRCSPALALTARCVQPSTILQVPSLLDTAKWRFSYISLPRGSGGHLESNLVGSSEPGQHSMGQGPGLCTPASSVHPSSGVLGFWGSGVL